MTLSGLENLRGLKSRLSLFYIVSFAVAGVLLPFWPVWLKDRGFDAEDIGLLLAAGIAAKVVTNPLAGQIADRSGQRRKPMIVLAALACLSYAFFFWVDGFWPVLILTVIGNGCGGALIPLIENTTLLAARAKRFDYGRVRLWGSFAFIGAAAAAGYALGWFPPGMILWMALGYLAMTAASAWALPDIRTPSGEGPVAPAHHLLRLPNFPLFLAAASLIQATHSVYYGFATLHWRQAGISDDIIGGLWAEGVIAEIVLFAFANRTVAKLGPERLMILAGIGGILRWAALASTTHPAMLMAAQTLHAFTFGAAHLGAMHFILRSVPPSFSARAQGFYSSVVQGGAFALATVGAGWLYKNFQGGAFWATAGISAVGGLLAFLLLRAQTRKTDATSPSPE